MEDRSPILLRACWLFRSLGTTLGPDLFTEDPEEVDDDPPCPEDPP